MENKNSSAPSINKPIVKLTEKSIEQPKVGSKLQYQKILEYMTKSYQYQKILEYMTKLYQYQIMQFLIQDPEMIQALEWSKQKLYRMSVGKFPYIQIQLTPLIPVILPIPEVLRSLSDFDPESNMDFKENSPFQEVVISEIDQRPVPEHNRLASV